MGREEIQANIAAKKDELEAEMENWEKANEELEDLVDQ